GQIVDFSRDLAAVGQQSARGFCDWHSLSQALAHGARELTQLVEGWVPARFTWADDAPTGIPAQRWRAALGAVAQACADALEALDRVSETGPDLERMYGRASQLLARIARFSGPPSPDTVRWLDAGSQLRLVESPLDIARAMRDRVLG